MPLQLRRGTNQEKDDLNLPLAEGEPLWVIDSRELYIGDGVTTASSLTPVVGYGDEEAQDAAASLLTSGTATDITFTYQDGSNVLDTSVSISQFRQNIDMASFDLVGNGNIDISGNISLTGNFTAQSIVSDLKGSVFADDSSILVDSVAGSINLAGTIQGNVLPESSGVYAIGDPGNRFNELYLSDELWIGMAQLTSSGAAFDLPAGSTINGQPLGEIAQPGNGLVIDIIGEDSTVLVNSSTGVFTGTFTGTFDGPVIGPVIGDVQGSVFLDDSTQFFDAQSGSINVPEIIATDNVLDIRNTTPGQETVAAVNSLDAAGVIALNYVSDSDLSTSNANFGRIEFKRIDNVGPLGTAIITATNNGMFFGAGLDQQFDSDAGKYVSIFDKKVGIGTFVPTSTLDVRGSGVFDGDVQASAFKGSLVADDSTIMIDAVNNTISSGGFIQFGNYTTAERTNLSAENGMVIYNSTDNKFQGYQNGIWINLDDGSAA